ncbi:MULTISPECIES: cyclic-di-AMP receptor [Tissierellales]|uniref:Transcriptional regulator n=1 Tax=Acidilutibacter cellobiosedens TaxID=2507161 RepID=A0A410Q969_9FIRM|nr:MULTISPECIES: cyclic-di-AMP receptor [Tissierellales]MBE6082086.1 hypothetical protein [Tissierellaceae bacterium]QAT60533.1 hypothetical protein EQM13_02550 [Acidilutibacter cellobiosedens]SCL86768.1 hypothetical protein PP176A_1151 [Sporanaerobacter sp. PP17-6a]
MKLIIAIVQDQDVVTLIDELTEKNFRVTKLSSTGGFLKSGNTTLLIGVENEKTQEVLKVIEYSCKTREITTSLLTMSMPGESYIPYPMQVKIGGATVFVVDVEQYIRV